MNIHRECERQYLLLGGLSVFPPLHSSDKFIHVHGALTYIYHMKMMERERPQIKSSIDGHVPQA
jgi:hypothetical protein